MNKSPLCIHEIKLVVKSPPGLSNGGGVGEHADRPLHLSQVPTRHHCGWLVVYPDLEPCGAPVYKLDSALGLDCCYCCVHILWNNISSIEHAASHVFPNSWVIQHSSCCNQQGKCC